MRYRLQATNGGSFHGITVPSVAKAAQLPWQSNRKSARAVQIGPLLHIDYAAIFQVLVAAESRHRYVWNPYITL
jgi:hypothetical protein